jgi:20S proteasome subunit beta 7
MVPAGKYTVVGASGEISDFQYIQTQLEKLMIDEFNSADDHYLGPENIYEYLHRVMYNRRTKMNFLWNTLIVGGIKNGKR